MGTLPHGPWAFTKGSTLTESFGWCFSRCVALSVALPASAPASFSNVFGSCDIFQATARALGFYQGQLVGLFYWCLLCAWCCSSAQLRCRPHQPPKQFQCASSFGGFGVALAIAKFCGSALQLPCCVADLLSLGFRGCFCRRFSAAQQCFILYSCLVSS